MKFLLVLLTTFVLSLPAMGQTKLSPDQQRRILEKITAATSAMKTMRCDFVQTKKMHLLKDEITLKGTMFYAQPRKLRWQYNSPYSYVFILNGNKVQIKSAKSSQKIDIQHNKMFRQIADIILNSITGGQLKSSADFNVDVRKSGTLYVARLLPKKKELKKLFNSIEVTFNSALTMIQSFKMAEKTGDTTIVSLNNVKTNIQLNESVFSSN